jgi:hypothetical protein
LVHDEAEKIKQLLARDYEARLRVETETKCKTEGAQSKAEVSLNQAETAEEEAERKVYQLRDHTNIKSSSTL